MQISTASNHPYLGGARDFKSNGHDGRQRWTHSQIGIPYTWVSKADFNADSVETL